MYGYVRTGGRVERIFLRIESHTFDNCIGARLCVVQFCWRIATGHCAATRVCVCEMCMCVCDCARAWSPSLMKACVRVCLCVCVLDTICLFNGIQLNWMGNERRKGMSKLCHKSVKGQRNKRTYGICTYSDNINRKTILCVHVTARRHRAVVGIECDTLTHTHIQWSIRISLSLHVDTHTICTLFQYFISESCCCRAIFSLYFFRAAQFFAPIVSFDFGVTLIFSMPIDDDDDHNK